MAQRVHLVYPRGPQAEAPWAIGRELGIRLERHYEVSYHDWDSVFRVKPGPEDVLVGHAHPCRFTCFRRSARLSGWERVLLMCPFNHDLRQVAFLDPLVASCDLYLAITGHYWFESVSQSALAHWKPKMVHVDMAINRQDYPAIERAINPVGRRRFLYIGHSGWQKNPAYLSLLAQSLPDFEFTWIGRDLGPLEGFARAVASDFRAPEARALVGRHDFLITAGLFDANPTTILEAMAWGLVPVCTPQSGYSHEPGVFNIPPDNLEQAIGVLKMLQNMPDEQLQRIRQMNFEALDNHYNYDRFARQVVDAIESRESPSISETQGSRRDLRSAATTSPYACWRWRNLVPFWRRAGLEFARKGRAALIDRLG